MNLEIYRNGRIRRIIDRNHTRGDTKERTFFAMFLAVANPVAFSRNLANM